MVGQRRLTGDGRLQLIQDADEIERAAMVKTAKQEKPLSQAIRERRATPSFDGAPIPAEDLRKIIEAGLSAPSGYNIQPWRFIVVQNEAQRRRLRTAAYNQAKVEEASAVIVACGDADGWRKDLEPI